MMLAESPPILQISAPWSIVLPTKDLEQFDVHPSVIGTIIALLIQQRDEVAPILYIHGLRVYKCVVIVEQRILFSKCNLKKVGSQ